MARRQAIKTLANRYQIPARQVFALLEEAKYSAEWPISVCRNGS